MRHTIQVTPEGQKAISALRRRQRDAFNQKLLEIAARGCAACGYKLTGVAPHWICCVHLSDNYRLITGHGDDHNIVILDVGPHSRDPRIDVYERLAQLFELKPPEGPRTKPPCCGKPSEIVDDPAAIDAMEAEFEKSREEFLEISDSNGKSAEYGREVESLAGHVKELEARKKKAHDQW